MRTEFLRKSTEDWPAQPADLIKSLDENEENVKKERSVGPA